MASLQYSSASWVAQYREFRPLTIVQPGNNGRHSINLVTKHTNFILKFSQISYDIKYNSKGNEWRSIMNLQQNLMEAMGQNVHFVIDSWMEEWKGKETPHTTGCNFFESQQIDGKLIISKITGVEEFPVKPGDWVLKLLKATIVVFDKLPFPAEQLLTRSEGTHERIIKLLEMSVAYNNN
ncbi:hypothetical protein GOBAR_AA09506 [Gossypium barbadense]|uniref:Uncharacterized protein n=1 Tax=Gossypium barbadense TaxID=3634 RepID=A0A2P5Y6H8_GOSBA|nr:hypothetical protein GOBAR_AA09506 [Gossypium barbadense]